MFRLKFSFSFVFSSGLVLSLGLDLGYVSDVSNHKTKKSRVTQKTRAMISLRNTGANIRICRKKPRKYLTYLTKNLRRK